LCEESMRALRLCQLLLAITCAATLGGEELHLKTPGDAGAGSFPQFGAPIASEAKAQRDPQGLGVGDPASKTYIIGATPVGPFHQFLSQFSPTFEIFLNTEVAPTIGDRVRFQLIVFESEDAVRMVKDKRIDFLYTNPSTFSCLELLSGAQAIATVKSVDPYSNETYHGLAGVVIAKANTSAAAEGMLGVRGRTVQASRP